MTAPTISIVTPSYNQGQFLEEAIQSVLSQDYPNLEYVVMDGGSTDASVDIIRKYESKLTYWRSAPDGGQYDAINQGFARTTGEIMAWLNSDDAYLPWTLSVVGNVFSALPEVGWITTLYPLQWDRRGRAVECGRRDGYSRHAFFRGRYVPLFSQCPEGCIQQESTFWRRSLWEQTGARVDASLRLAGDFELWARFFRCVELYGVNTPLGGFRIHPAQKTAQHLEAYSREAERVLREFRGRFDRPIESIAVRLSRQINWPRSLRRAAAKCRLCEERNVCVNQNGRWYIQTL